MEVKPAAPRKTLIACGIFADELRAVLPQGQAEVVWLDSGLHVEPKLMERQLRRAGKAAAGKSESGPVRLLVGSACHPEMAAVAEGCGAAPAPFKNCIEAFVGERRLRELEAGRTLVITPGWVRAWPGRDSALGWDETDMRIQHGRYDRILVMDPGIKPVSDEEVLALFDLIRVPIEVAPLDLELFRKTVLQVIE